MQHQCRPVRRQPEVPDLDRRVQREEAGELVGAQIGVREAVRLRLDIRQDIDPIAARNAAHVDELAVFRPVAEPEEARVIRHDAL